MGREGSRARDLANADAQPLDVLIAWLAGRLDAPIASRGSLVPNAKQPVGFSHLPTRPLRGMMDETEQF